MFFRGNASNTLAGMWWHAGLSYKTRNTYFGKGREGTYSIARGEVCSETRGTYTCDKSKCNPFQTARSDCRGSFKPWRLSLTSGQKCFYYPWPDAEAFLYPSCPTRAGVGTFFFAINRRRVRINLKDWFCVRESLAAKLELEGLHVQGFLCVAQLLLFFFLHIYWVEALPT